MTMRSHQFAENLNVAYFTPEVIIMRLRYYCRTRFARPTSSKKGRAQSARHARLLICKPWKR